jgi:hypothetical protein
MRDRELLPPFREFMGWLVREGLRNGYVADDKVQQVGREGGCVRCDGWGCVCVGGG